MSPHLALSAGSHTTLRLIRPQFKDAKWEVEQSIRARDETIRRSGTELARASWDGE